KEKFVNWLYTEKNHSINYVAKGLEVIRQFLAAARDQGLHENDYPQSKLFRQKKIPTATIALSREELDAISAVDLSEHPDGYEKARTLFLIGAYTGLRHSDYKRIKPEHISDGQISILSQKTRQQLLIPLHPNLEKVLEQCGYRSPRLSQQRLNEHIKEIARMAGITEKRAVYTSAGGKVVEEFTPKYKSVSSHTARRTFATQARIDGWPTTLIRAITGHSTDQQLDNYIDYDMYLAAVQVKDYFQKGKDRGLKIG
ncbi:MAG: integrase catalytic domain-containing protein, partial [Sinomicrobium sp.]|nr:integrase catalytic domain-containing protein [Sinomicrobium sp.]